MSKITFFLSLPHFFHVQGSNSEMVKSIFNDPFKEHCPETNKAVPYFARPKGSTINGDIVKSIKVLDKQEYTLGEDLASNEHMPDGSITFFEQSKDGIRINVQINDLKLPEYHRNNGITKFAFRYGAEQEEIVAHPSQEQNKEKSSKDDDSIFSMFTKPTEYSWFKTKIQVRSYIQII